MSTNTMWVNILSKEWEYDPNLHHALGQWQGTGLSPSVEYTHRVIP